MGTFLFDEIIFGPVNSRRLGASLGINLLPLNGKVCNFNCVYCECGWNPGPGEEKRLPSRDSVREALDRKMSEMAGRGELPDTITFAGNGEPTVHPDFPGIISDTLEIRDRMAPSVRIAVLSNATRLDRPDVFSALSRIDMNILKLDSANERTIRLVNQPHAGFDLGKVLEGMRRFRGNFILQTLLVSGEYQGQPFDNSSVEEIDGWLNKVREVCPSEVMLYTIDRDTPIRTIRKVGPERLDEIAAMVREAGFRVQVSY